jgi:RNA recognition motif-containing protein
MGAVMIIYIGNLPQDVYEDELVEMFEEYGAVKSAKIIRDQLTKRSRGYAFVKMDDKDAALKAIEEWDEGSIDDQIIKVQEARFTKRSRRKR